jgi:hypothetical protein
MRRGGDTVTTAEGRAIFFDALLFVRQMGDLQARGAAMFERDTTVMASKTANA